jgi:hypothetical protein
MLRRILTATALAATFGAAVAAAAPAFADWGPYPSGATSAGQGLNAPFGPLITPPMVPQTPIFGGH